MGMPIIFYRDTIPHKDSWVRYLVNRTMKKNNNNLVSVVGKTGSGKTWSAISICEMMSKLDGVPFTIDHVVFSLTELMELINSGKLVRGSKIVFDEPQISISAREFQSEANKVFNYLLSTFRHRNLTLFFCTPFESLLDKNTRRLFHARLLTEHIDLKTKTCRLKPRVLEFVDGKDDPYTPRLIINNMKGHTKIDFWSIPKPSVEIIKFYEDKKLEFTNRLNKKITERLQRYEDGGKSMTGEVQESRAYVKLTPKEELAFKLEGEGYSHTKIAEMLRISIPRVTQLIQNANNKGYYNNFKPNPLKIALLRPNKPIPAV